MVKQFVNYGLKLNKALNIVGMKKSIYYYKNIPEDIIVMDKIKAFAYKHHFYGYRKIWACLRKEGYVINQKKVYRIYCKLNLQKSKPKRKKSSQSSTTLINTCFSNHVWAIDFTFIALENAKRIKVISLEDTFSKKTLLTFSDYSITSDKVIELLQQAITLFGKPVILRSDNGPEFISKTLNIYLTQERIKHEFIPKGKPYYNGFMERFMGSLKHECLVASIFKSLDEVNKTVLNYQQFYNTVRPHQSLNYKFPDEVYRFAVEKT